MKGRQLTGLQRAQRSYVVDGVKAWMGGTAPSSAPATSRRGAERADVAVKPGPRRHRAAHQGGQLALGRPGDDEPQPRRAGRRRAAQQLQQLVARPGAALFEQLVVENKATTRRGAPAPRAAPAAPEPRTWRNVTPASAAAIGAKLTRGVVPKPVEMILPTR